MKNQLIIPDSDAMMALGGKIADQFPHGGIVLLNGDLGAGKTTLVRGLLRHLGYEGIVKSPTYTLVEPYLIEENGGSSAKTGKRGGGVLRQSSAELLSNRTIYHFDLYRLADPEELEYIGGRDYWNSNALCLIEWPEKAKGYLPEADLEITIHHQDEARLIAVEKGNISL
ncbi:MAG: tRNA (adenosine(37)-N6)-threonylcarbamoyltransferase complex ATPase subunit type 1 TsaE [Cocleimonas sp.]